MYIAQCLLLFKMRVCEVHVKAQTPLLRFVVDFL